MSARIAALWRGEVRLARVFWEYTIGWGTLLNLAFTGIALAAILRGAPAWIGLLLHFLPMPWNALLVVSVFRAAARERTLFARIAPAAVLGWFALMFLI